MNYKIKRIETGEVIISGNNLASLTVLDGDFVIITSDGKSTSFDKVLYNIEITSADDITITCYGKTEKWNNRQAAINHFLSCMMSSEGSEQERYSRIYMQLLDGATVCSDEENW